MHLHLRLNLRLPLRLQGPVQRHRHIHHGTRLRQAGFTLIEVLVALAIVAIALGAGLRAAGVLTDNAARLRDVIAAQWCAGNELTNLRITHTFPGVGDADFSCEQLGRSYRGKLVTRPTLNAFFRRVEAVVSDDSGHVLITLSTVVSRQ